MASHKDLANADLHEPKGISAASDNEVATSTSNSIVWKKLTASNVDSTGAAVGHTLVADGAGGVSWNASSLHYGQMNIIANSTAQTTSAAAHEQLKGDDASGKWVTGLLSGITFSSANQNLVVADAGVYILDFWSSFKAPNSSITKFYFSTDGGTTLSTQTMSRSSTASTDLGVVSARSIVTLSAANAVQIHLENSVGGAVTLQDCGMSLLQIVST